MSTLPIRWLMSVGERALAECRLMMEVERERIEWAAEP
jgi:hypothetical protein